MRYSPCMHSVSTTPIRERKPRKRPAVTVFMRPGALARLYDAIGLPRNSDKTLRYHDIAADLGLPSASSLHNADREKAPRPVNAALIASIRNRFPHIKYEEVFVEGVHPDVQAKKQAA
jgi:hypothetical protein